MSSFAGVRLPSRAVKWPRYARRERGTRPMFKPGYRYTKAGVMPEDLAAQAMCRELLDAAEVSPLHQTHDGWLSGIQHAPVLHAAGSE